MKFRVLAGRSISGLAPDHCLKKNDVTFNDKS